MKNTMTEIEINNKIQSIKDSIEKEQKRILELEKLKRQLFPDPSNYERIRALLITKIENLDMPPECYKLIVNCNKYYNGRRNDKYFSILADILGRDEKACYRSPIQIRGFGKNKLEIFITWLKSLHPDLEIGMDLKPYDIYPFLSPESLED